LYAGKNTLRGFKYKFSWQKETFDVKRSLFVSFMIRLRGMNDTNLNDRQKKILKVLKEAGSVSRLVLAGQISPDAGLLREVYLKMSRG
jgi:hypothetical protein